MTAAQPVSLPGARALKGLSVCIISFGTTLGHGRETGQAFLDSLKLSAFALCFCGERALSSVTVGKNVVSESTSRDSLVRVTHQIYSKLVP